MVENSVRPNIPKDGIFGGRKWWNIPAEDYSTIICPYSVIVGIFRHFLEYSDNCSGEVPIFSHFKTKAACSNVFTSELKTEEASVWQNGRCRCQCHGVCGSYYSVKGRNIPL